VTDVKVASNAGLAALSNDVVTSPNAVGAAIEPDLDSFAHSVLNGNANQVAGIYVSGVLALPVRQQPNDNPNFVSTDDGVVTQFAAASRFRTIGLLAHNYLAGTLFSNLKLSQVVSVIFGDGHMKTYRINKVERYQALSPTSPQSDFIDLNDGKNSRLTAGDVFQRIYTQGDSVVFQTCILNNGDPSWGRLFITAIPVETSPSTFVSPARMRMFDRWL
jgi:hypothetical protein